MATTIDFNPHRARMGIGIAKQFGLDTRVLARSGGLFHAKVIVARRDGHDLALVGSSNLTGGIHGNVEAGVLLRGDEATRTWAAAEGWWDTATEPQPGQVLRDTFDPVLLRRLTEALGPLPAEVWTLGPRPARNEVLDLTPHHVLVRTFAADGQPNRPSKIPPRMFTVLIEEIDRAGSVSSVDAQAARGGLRVMRSSFVLAALARLPEYAVIPGDRLVLGRRPDGDVALAAESAGPPYTRASRLDAHQPPIA